MDIGRVRCSSNRFVQIVNGAFVPAHMDTVSKASIVIGSGIIRIQAYGLAVVAYGLLIAAELEIRIPPVVEGKSIVRFYADGLVEIRNGRRILLRLSLIHI